MGRDVERGAPITIVGTATCRATSSANGLLYSRNVKLLAAFDHRDIFLDPNPDPAKSYGRTPSGSTTRPVRDGPITIPR